MNRMGCFAMLIASCLTGMQIYAEEAPKSIYITGNVGIGSGEDGGIQSKDGTEGIELSTEGNAANIFSVDGIVLANTGLNAKAYVRFVENLDGEGRSFGPATVDATVEASGTNSWNKAVEMAENTNNFYTFEPGVYNFVIDCRTSPYKIQVQKHTVSIVNMIAIGKTGAYTGLVDESNQASEFLVRVGDKFFTGKETGIFKNVLGQEMLMTKAQPLGKSFELAPYDFAPHTFTNTATLKMATNEIIGDGLSSYTTLGTEGVCRRFFYNPDTNYFIAINSELAITTGTSTSPMTYNPSNGTFTGTVGEVKSSWISKTGFYIGINSDNYVYGNEIKKIEGDLYSITPQLFVAGSWGSNPACVCTDTSFSKKVVTFDPMAMTLLLGELDTSEPAAPTSLYFCGVQPLKKQDDANIYSGVVSMTKMFDDVDNPAFYVCENSSFPYGYAISPTRESLTTVTVGTPTAFNFNTSLFDSLWQLDATPSLYHISVNWDTKQMKVEKLSENNLPEAESIAKLEEMDYANFTGDVICEYNESISELYVSDQQGALFNIDLHNADEAVIEALSPENFKRGDRIRNFGAINLADPHTFTIFSLDLKDGSSPYIVKAENEYVIPKVESIGEENVYKMVSISGALNIGNYVSTDNTIVVDGTHYVILSNFATAHLPAQSEAPRRRALSKTENWNLGDQWPTLENYDGKVTGVVIPHNDGYALNATGIEYDVPVVTGIESIISDENRPVEYFNMQGVRVDNPTKGIYIRKTGASVEKVAVK